MLEQKGVRVNGLHSRVRKCCIISHRLFNVYMGAMMNEVKMGMGRRGKSGDYLSSCMQMTWFFVVSRRRT